MLEVAAGEPGNLEEKWRERELHSERGHPGWLQGPTKGIHVTLPLIGLLCGLCDPDRVEVGQTQGCPGASTSCASSGSGQEKRWTWYQETTNRFPGK